MHQISKTLIDWYSLHKRDLPWRHTTDPYKILVSEIMLQQTQVDRVIPKYQSFLTLFPTALALAVASTHELLGAWFGLGYNRRALHLQQAASYLSQNDCPQTIQELQMLPGIGLYTARALLAFAFNKKVHVLDTNVKRVYSRLFPETLQYNDVQWLDFLEQFIPDDARTYNNAIMEFGALQCTKKPDCSSCPLQTFCYAYKTTTQHVYWQPPRQSTFVGSQRYYRSKILQLLHQQALPYMSIKKSLDETFFTKYSLDTILEGLIKDKFIEHEGAVYFIRETLKDTLQKNRTTKK